MKRNATKCTGCVFIRFHIQNEICFKLAKERQLLGIPFFDWAFEQYFQPISCENGEIS